MIAPIYSDFLVLWDTLAKSNTCPELKTSWNRVLEHAEKIEIEGLNELWNFYLERLEELEGRTGPMIPNKKEKR